MALIKQMNKSKVAAWKEKHPGRAPKTPVFLCPPAGGWAFPYLYIAMNFDEARPLYSFQAPT